MTASAFRVLLIDDDAALARMLSEYLSGYGLAVDWAGDAEGGLAKLRSGAIAEMLLGPIVAALCRQVPRHGRMALDDTEIRLSRRRPPVRSATMSIA